MLAWIWNCAGVLGGVLLLLGSARLVSAASVDPAPLADEIVEKLVRAPLRQRMASVPEALERHVKDIVDLLGQMHEEDQAHGGPDEDAAISTTSQMLLESKLHELRIAWDELRTEAARVRARLTAVGLSDQQSAWDALLAGIESRFARITKVVEAVHHAQTRGARARALKVARTESDRGKGSAVPAQESPIPTVTSDQPRWQAPAPNNAPPPQYVTSVQQHRMHAFAGPMLLADAPPTPTEAQVCNYTAADLGQSQEIQLTTEIQALAASLSYSPARIFQYVANEIAFEPYYGSLKGATGTLYAAAGNATDQASLLIALLRAANIPARYVKGNVSFVEDPRVLRWVGAKEYFAAAAILNMGWIPVVYGVSGNQHIVQFTHVWVEACVPYGNYRGTGIDRTGHRWIPLDPSFKDKSYQSGIATNVTFDYTTYLAARTSDLPHERYSQQIDTYVKTQPPSFANNTVADVGYIGRIVPHPRDILPASLPYEVIAFNAWASNLTAETAEVPENHRVKLTIAVANSASQALGPSTTLSLPESVLQRVTLSFKGATAGDQSALDSWKGSQDVNAALPCSINVVPVIKVEGVDKAIGTTSVGLCTTTNRLTMSLTLGDVVTPSNPSGTTNTVSYTTIQAGDYHALEAYAFQTSDRLLRERAAKLLAAVRSTPNPNTNQDETEGEFLHLVGLKYMRYHSDASKRIGELDGASGQSGNHLGLTSSRMKVAYVFDQPYSIQRSAFLVDVLGGQYRSLDLTTGQAVWKSFKLVGYNASAYESYIWQENARLDAVSTVRGIQFATEQGIPILTITSANQGTEIPKLTSNSNGALNYPSSSVAIIQSLINSGFTVTAPRSLIQYQNWTGAVWVSEFNNGPDMRMGLAIGGAYAGGYTIGPPAPESFSPTTGGTGTGFVADAPATVTTGTFTSAQGQGTTSYTVTAGDPVNMVTGNMYHTERDLTIKGRGLPLVFERTYNSRGPTDGPLGFGWTHSFNHVLAFSDDNANGVVDAADTDGITSSVTWTDGTGSQKFITVAGTTSGVPIGSVFTTPLGFFFQVARQSDGTYTIREKNGLTYTFENVPGTVGQRARLLRISDRNGNSLTLSYTGALLTSVTDGLSRSLTFAYNANSRLSQMSDWTGRSHQYTYDTAGNLTAYKNPLAVAGSQNPVTYSYYSDTQLNHVMASYTLPRGNGMTFQYYMNGRVFKHTTTLGETTTFTYNEFRRETISINERGFARQFIFDKYGNPTKIVEENGGERAYTYDPAKPLNRLTARAPMGDVTSYVYDANGNVTRVTLPSGNTIDYSFFTAFNQPGKVKDPRGNYTIVKYDAHGNVLQTIRLRSGLGSTIDPTTYTPAAGDVVAWTINTYDSLGNVLTTKQVRDAATQAGPTLEYDYNDTVNNAQGLNAVGITRRGDKNGDGVIASGELDTATLTYDALGRVTTGLRPDWYATQLTYDAVDRVTRSTDAVGQLRDYGYDTNGNLISESLTVGNSIVDQKTATYDLSDRKITSADAGGFMTRFQYDAAGNATALTNPDNYTVRVDYDASNRAVRTYNESNGVVSRTLDLDGKARTVTDPNGNTVTFFYFGSEKDRRLQTQADALSHATSFDYDAAGNVTSMTDAAGRVTLTTYDELNRPTRVVGPVYTDPTYGTVRPVTKFTYNLLGFPTQMGAGRTDATGTNPASDVTTPQMTYVWDDFGRKLRETDALNRMWTTTYDVQGNPLTVTDVKNQTTSFMWGYGHQLLSRTAGSHVTSYTRNLLGQVLTVNVPEVTYTRAYDTAHRLMSVRDGRANKTLAYSWSPGGLLNTLTDSEGQRTDYVYDPVGRLAELWAPNGDVMAFTYDGGGRLTEKWFPNGVTARYAYNPDNTLRQLVNRHGSGTIISQHDYTYDAVRNRVTQQELINGTTTPYKYVYDPLNRLTEVRNNVTNALIESYTYDTLGNRLSKTDGAGNTLAFVFDAANQLNEAHQGSPTGPLAMALVYDANGSLTKKCEGGTVTGTPTTCSGATVTDLTYDQLNRTAQITKTGIIALGYAYDDGGRRIQKTVGGVATNYLYNGGVIHGTYSSLWDTPASKVVHSSGIDTPLMRITSTSKQYFHQDGLGSVVAVTSVTGAVDGSARYDAWGNTVGSTGAIAVYGYTGREPDETGLSYYRARYYDPALGRFAQRDPIGLAGGVNPYVYVDDNPSSYTDASGECIPCAFAAGGALVGVGVQVYSDYRSGKLSSGTWSAGSYVGAVTTGAVAGLGLMFNPGLTAAAVIGGGGGFSGNLVKQTIDIATGAQKEGFNRTELGLATAAGVLAAGVLRPAAGVLEPSYAPIAQGLLTKYLVNGAISSLSPSVAVKTIGARIVGENAIPEAVLGEVIKDTGMEALQGQRMAERPLETEIRAAPTQGGQNLGTLNPQPQPKP